MKRWLVAGLVAAGCGSEGDIRLQERPRDALRPAPEQGLTRQIVPGPWLPDEYQRRHGPSNNNLDVVRHNGRVFLAIRNGKTHFASSESLMYVFSSSDEQTWSFERVYDLKTDLREPRLLSHGGRLFLYLAKLGDKPTAFEPQGTFVSEYLGPRSWTEPERVEGFPVSFIVWRVKSLGERAYLTAYENGEHEYDLSGKPLFVHFLASEDGRSWRGVDPDQPVVSTGGGSETDFAIDDRGDLYAVIRNESGDETGWGSKICHAPRQALARWQCRHDPKKYDSPLVFAHNGEIFLIGRRNATADGKFEVHKPAQGWSASDALKNLVEYSNQPKRTALWQLDRATLEVRWVSDLPGHGDTCFPSILRDPDDERKIAVYNYSSPLESSPDITWRRGQDGETRIYRTPLQLW